MSEVFSFLLSLGFIGTHPARIPVQNKYVALGRTRKYFGAIWREDCTDDRRRRCLSIGLVGIQAQLGAQFNDIAV